MIKAVILDIDGVLIDSFKANLKYYQDVMKAAGYPEPSAKIYKQGIWMTMWDNVKRLTKARDQKEIKRIWDIANQTPIPVHLYKKPKGLLRTIKKLGQNYRLAVVTSRTKQAAKAALDFLKINAYFDAIIAFQDFKHPKPHPEPLLKALKKLKIKAEEAVYVGDNHTDLLAAKAAKVKFIGFGKKSLKGADHQTNQFIKLPKLIDKNRINPCKE